MKNLTFSPDRALEVLSQPYTAYKLRQGLYAVRHDGNGDAVQDKFVPRSVVRGSREHTVFLYFATGTDRRSLSSQVYRNHMELWSRSPELYRRGVLNLHHTTIKRKLAEVHFNMVETIGRNWRPCAETLFEEFGGDPVSLYKDQSIDALLEYKKRNRRDGRDPLPGFGPKILSLLAIYYEKLGVVPPIEGAFPVDVHIQRICISTGIVSGKGVIDSASVGEYLRPRLYELCVREGWDRSDLAHALWFNGNELCNGCSTSRNSVSLCAVYNDCSGGLNTRQYGREGKWDFDQVRQRKGGPNNVLF